MNVACSQISLKERSFAAGAISELKGSVCHCIHSSTSVLISGTVISKKYSEAVSLKIPIVSIDWLYACQKHKYWLVYYFLLRKRKLFY